MMKKSQILIEEQCQGFDIVTLAKTIEVRYKIIITCLFY